MTTVGAMIDRISDEMEDDSFDAGGQALKAINDAIREYRDKGFWFCRVIGKTFTLPISTEYLIPTLVVTGISSTEPLTTVYQMMIDDGLGANYSEVVEADNSYLDAAQTGNVVSRPKHFSLVADSTGTQIRFYPITDQAYTPKVNALIRFADLAIDADTNPWTNDAELLIRRAAKRILMSEITRELPPDAPPGAGEMKAFNDLMKTTRTRMGNAMPRTEVAFMQGRGRRLNIYTGG